jgi:hypothetical protein
MRNAIPIIAVVAVLAMGIPLAASQEQKRETQKAGQKKKPEGASLTGCVDQQEGQYVLVDDHEMKVIAGLEAEGFPLEGFAKHVGQKVTVRGTTNPGATRTVFKVRTIETVSETCAPQAAQDGKK